jgi:hypothetical protein
MLAFMIELFQPNFDNLLLLLDIFEPSSTQNLQAAEMFQYKFFKTHNNKIF